MIQVKRKDLEIVAQYIDTNNPKYELNYLLVDKVNIVATNTRVLGVIKHKGELDKGIEQMFIHKSIVDLALKQRGAVCFDLDENKIVCLGIENIEIITISINNNSSHMFYPKYENIIPKSLEKEIPFIKKTQIEGILATERIEVDNRYIPTTAAEMIGYIGINDKNTPIVIMNEDKEVIIVAMPIIDSFDMFREEGAKDGKIRQSRSGKRRTTKRDKRFKEYS